MKPADAADEYKRVMGLTAFNRQRELAASRYPCCNALKKDGHLPLCSSHPWREA